ncbi:hypothetical protein M408DRAFT_327301 [Serendipita vermifera MAFF 305830]|uniref:Exonuclease domain-containing protein n=1 Tax=Serendipita vermifera MAFF 305830 TaxID=933852 RepID=A0A0C3B4Z9_SERVB|nr:hypothetical protein M408DRAFT_327301 [Serendipita vermifera MAFF 305830]
MSKRTSTSRSSPPSPHRFYKKQKTTDTSIISTSSPPTNNDAMIVDPSSTSPVGGTLHSHMSAKNAQSNAKEGVSGGGTRRAKDRSRSPKVKPPKPASPPPHGSNELAGNGWTKVEKKKEKRAKKGALKVTNQPPSFAFNVQELVKLGTLSISDIRELALHLTGNAQPPSWLRITNRPSIQRVVVLLVPGIVPDVFTPPLRPLPNTSNPLLHVPALAPSFASTSTPTATSKLPFLSTFMHAVPTKAPGDAQRMHSVLHSFFMGPVTGEEKKRRIMARIQNERDKAPPIASYLLTREQLLENEYPVPNWMLDSQIVGEDWLQTPEFTGDPNEECQVLALDCEMCITTAGRELTHLCIIDYTTSTKIYDELVLPSGTITDYLTRFSGITPTSLDSTTTTLADVHAFLRKTITPSTILLGHSLEGDLKAMKLAHARCLDTSVLYHHPRGRPLKPGLKWLMNKWMNKDIQDRGEGGHDPEEDARSCVDLFRLKVQNGPGYGHFMVDVENILERIGRSGGPGRNMRTAVVDYGNPSTWLGSKATSTVACTSDDDVVKGVQDLIGSHQFVFGRMLELSERLGWTVKKGTTAAAVAGTPPTTPLLTPALPTEDATVIESKSVEETYKSLNDNLVAIYRCLPPATAFILLSGHGDPRRMSELNTKKSAFEGALREGKSTAEIPREEWWTAQEGRDLEDEVEKAKHGLLFLGMK